MRGTTVPALLDPGNYLAPVAIAMVAFISFLLTRAVRVKDDGIDAAIVLLLLGMMVAMLLGPAYLYLTTLGFGISDVVIWEIAVFMTLGMMPTAGLTGAKLVLQSEAGRKGPALAALVEHTSELRAAYVVLLVLSEFLMGWTFNLASGLIRLSSGYSLVDVANQFQYSLTSYWFVFTMVGEMAFTLFALRKVLRPDLLKILAIQAVVMFLTPTALSSRLWETYTFYLEAVVMTGLVAFAFVYLRGGGERDGPTLSYLGLFIIANTAMMVGLLLWLVDGDSLVLALSLILQTAIYFDAVFTGAGLGETFHP